VFLKQFYTKTIKLFALDFYLRWLIQAAHSPFIMMVIAIMDTPKYDKTLRDT